MTHWISEVPLLLTSHESLTKSSCALAQLAWNAFTPRSSRISYPSLGAHKLNKSSVEFAGGLSPCCAGFGNLYFYVVPVTVTRAHIHSDACATRCRPSLLLFFSYHPIATYVTFCSFKSFAALSKIATGRSHLNK